MAILFSAVNLLLALSVLVLASNVDAKFYSGPWKNAFATFYGDPYGTGATGGACGYEDTRNEGYGIMTTALSSVLFNNGATCGACYEMTCDFKGTKFCIRRAKSIKVTTKNFCPPNYNLPNNNGGWCNPPREHFDLSQPAFLQMAERKAGIVPVRYRRVPCKRTGGIRFSIGGNPYFNLVKVFNVGGVGDVVGLEVSGGGNGKWTKLSRNFGQKWDTHVMLVGMELSFKVTTSDAKTLIVSKVADKNWEFGQTFESKTNFF